MSFHYGREDYQHKEQTHLFLGLDLGKNRDFSALAALEYKRTWTLVRNLVNYGMDPEDEKVEYTVRQLARVPLGTRYLDVVQTVQDLLRKVAKSYDCTLIVDATGVGAPVIEMFEDAMPPQRSKMVSVVITASCTPDGAKTAGRNEWKVPRHDLLTSLQMMLETEQIIIGADLKHSQALHEELLEMRSLKSGGSGKHDDLTMALALACWRARKVQPPPLTGDGVPKPKPFGFQNNAFGQAIYGTGTSPWAWPVRVGGGRRKDDDI
jgi:hypothetical protein